MIEIVYRGGIGDRLFQYSLGRVLADRWGMALRAGALPGFTGAVGREGRRYFAPFRCWSGLALEDRQTSSLVRDRQLAVPLEGRLMLFGWFHRWEYYRAHWPGMREWLACAPARERAKEGDLAVVMRFRQPGAWEEPTIHSGYPPAWGRVVPSLEAVRRLLERVAPARVVIFSDQPSRVPVDELAAWPVEVRALGTFHAWNELRTFRRMAIPAGHADEWWAARLSEAEEIYVCDPWTPEEVKNCAQEYG
jgi:diadenosine tetraphosphatase ApaH/serine/threonine PP2A family protein phosphatase